MGRLKLDFVVLTLALVLVNCVVHSEYFVQAPRSLYIVQNEGTQLSLENSGSDELIQESQFQSRKGVPEPKEAEAESEEEEEEEDEESSAEEERSMPMPTNGRGRPVQLRPGFDRSVNQNMQHAKRPKRPLFGDPSPIHEDEEREGRKPESRLLWPFSIEINKGAEKGGWGGPEQHGSHQGHHGGGGHGGGGHHGGGHQGGGHHGGGGGGRGGQHKFHFSAGHKQSHGPHDGWGWDAYIEHEKHKLKYEILKLKAKKKIAVLQNKVELKKLLSMLLQKKIQALEWW